jgi:hypothetical protein
MGLEDRQNVLFEGRSLSGLVAAGRVWRDDRDEGNECKSLHERASQNRYQPADSPHRHFAVVSV